MQHIAAMDVSKSKCQLNKPKQNLVLIQDCSLLLALRDDLVEIPTVAVLHDNVQVHAHQGALLVADNARVVQLGEQVSLGITRMDEYTAT